MSLTVTLTFSIYSLFSKLNFENTCKYSYKVTVKDIKSKVNVKAYNPVLNSFKNIRDALSHGVMHDDYVDKIIVLFNQSELHSVLTDIMPSEFIVEFYKLLDFLNGPEYEAKRTLEEYRLQNNVYSESDWLIHYANLSKLADSTRDIDVARIVKNNFLY